MFRFGLAKTGRGSSVGKSAAFITLRSWVRLPPSTQHCSNFKKSFVNHAGVVQPGLRRLPVTEEIRGSNPLARARYNYASYFEKAIADLSQRGIKHCTPYNEATL